MEAILEPKHTDSDIRATPVCILEILEIPTCLNRRGKVEEKRE